MTKQGYATTETLVEERDLYDFGISTSTGISATSAYYHTLSSLFEEDGLGRLEHLRLFCTHTKFSKKKTNKGVFGWAVTFKKTTVGCSFLKSSFGKVAETESKAPLVQQL